MSLVSAHSEGLMREGRHPSLQPVITPLCCPFVLILGSFRTEFCTKLFKMSHVQVQAVGWQTGEMSSFPHQSFSLLSTWPTSCGSDRAAGAARASIELNGPQITPLFLYSSTAQ